MPVARGLRVVCACFLLLFQNERQQRASRPEVSGDGPFRMLCEAAPAALQLHQLALLFLSAKGFQTILIFLGACSQSAGQRKTRKQARSVETVFHAHCASSRFITPSCVPPDTAWYLANSLGGDCVWLSSQSASSTLLLPRWRVAKPKPQSRKEKDSQCGVRKPQKV